MELAGREQSADGRLFLESRIESREPSLPYVRIDGVCSSGRVDSDPSLRGGSRRNGMYKEAGVSISMRRSIVEMKGQTGGV